MMLIIGGIPTQNDAVEYFGRAGVSLLDDLTYSESRRD
jgi:hypothetical protein